MTNHIYTLLLATFFTLPAASVTAQQEQKRQEKIEKREQRKEERKKNKEKLLSLVEEKSFVIEANTIYGRYMNRHEVLPSTNFVKIEGDQVTIQSASDSGPGYNGLGGLTVNGTITRYEIKENKGSLYLQVHFTNVVPGHSMLNINISPNGFATARINDNRGGRATFQGNVVHPDNSRTFEGMSVM